MSAAKFQASALIVLLLAACSASDEGELQTWINEQRNQVKPQITPISEPKKFIPQPYEQEAAMEPFAMLKLTLALKRDSATSSANAALITPELSRRKEALESYPLDVMQLVGSIDKAGKLIALVKVDKLLFQVGSGNYLGQNYGRVTKIGETEVVLREIVQDASGEWIERVATLQLQEKTK